MTRSIYWVLLAIWTLTACKSSYQTTSDSTANACAARIAFYNVENLFDTIDDPIKLDDEFTPEGKKAWTNERYQTKLSKLGRVVEALEFPAIIGLCEVENKAVLKDLVAQANFQDRKYGIAHGESPDVRGIDVALLYDQRSFKLLKQDFIRIDFPSKIVEDYTTRDVLYVKGVMSGKDTLHLFVNHWPSRRGGLEASEPKRSYVATQVKKRVEAIWRKNADANIVLMGDFNDEPSNNSIRQALGAQDNPLIKSRAALINCFSKLHAEELGTYKYRGKWNMLDQIIVSKPLAQTFQTPSVKNATIFKPEWLIFKHEKYGDLPNRTYGGPNYYGGFSDHFAIYVDWEASK